jgi:hypothetical protein
MTIPAGAAADALLDQFPSPTYGRVASTDRRPRVHRDDRHAPRLELPKRVQEIKGNASPTGKLRHQHRIDLSPLCECHHLLLLGTIELGARGGFFEDAALPHRRRGRRRRSDRAAAGRTTDRRSKRGKGRALSHLNPPHLTDTTARPRIPQPRHQIRSWRFEHVLSWVDQRIIRSRGSFRCQRPGVPCTAIYGCPTCEAASIMGRNWLYYRSGYQRFCRDRAALQSSCWHRNICRNYLSVRPFRTGYVNDGKKGPISVLAVHRLLCCCGSAAGWHKGTF